MTWKQLIVRDCRKWKLSAINPHDRYTWRSGVRSAMRAASQLSGRGPTDVDVALYLHVNQKSNYDDMMMILGSVFSKNFLSAHKKTQHLKCARELLKTHKGCNSQVISNLLTGDETWVHMFEPQRRADNKQWK